LTTHPANGPPGTRYLLKSLISTDWHETCPVRSIAVTATFTPIVEHRKMRLFKLTTLAAFLSVPILATAGIPKAQAGLIGETVSVDYLWPDSGTVLFPGGSAVVGAP
jgi:hypothetical protein